VIVGTGPERPALERIAGPDVRFLGWQSDDQVRDWYAGCRALLFPGEEDFGIVPLETQACGKPVIAFGRGGALETVVDGETGLFFAEQTVDALAAAMTQLEQQYGRFVPARIRAHAMQFDRAVFKQRIKDFVQQTMGVSWSA
jgi:glycosyltransferase involved in cell wall biosynthesis